ncbi:MAG: PKD domain-containing protein [Euryarchaeota archaeon]|nr:PKD domain-containing protein [Euryarchaeota archaeon]
MRKALAVLGALVLVLSSPLAPLSGGAGRVLDPTMYTVLTAFSDNSTESMKSYFGAGTNLSTSVKVPKVALVKSASVEVSGFLLDLEGAFTHDTASDFANGAFVNASSAGGSIVLRPFLNRTPVRTGNSPVALAAGDVNYDGRDDLVVVNGQGASISVLIQNATNGTMQPQVTYPVGQGPQGVAIGDLNGDGRLDVAVACSGLGTLEVLLQDVSGVLQGALSYSSGNGARAVAIADFNFDLLDDAVVVNSVDRTLSLFIQDRQHVLSLVGTFPTGSNPVSVAAGDINGDNRAEAVVVNKDDNSITVYEQNATTWLRRAAAYDVGAGPGGVAVADIDRDGRIDVVVAEQSNSTVGLLMQAGDGKLLPPVSYPAGGGPFWVAVGDLTYDGRPDIACALGANRSVSLLFQDTDGTYLPPELYRAGNGPECVAIADLNLDGKRDFAAADRADNNLTVYLLRPTRPGTLNQMVTYNVGGSPVGLVRGDFNTDGLDDIASANTLTGGAGCSVLLQTRAFQIANQVQYSVGNPSQPLQALAVADFDRDGRDDLVFSNRGQAGATVFWQTAAGDFSGTPTTYYTNVGNSGAYLAAAGDLNSDGWPDIVISNINNQTVDPDPDTVSVFLQDPVNGTFFPPRNYTCEGSRGVAVGDVNSDNRNDLVCVAQATNEVVVYYQAADGTLKVPGTRLAADAATHSVRIGDVNADGRNDIVATAWTANTVNVYTQTAAGGLNSRVSYSVASNAVDLEIIDYDGDGLNDLAVSHYQLANTVSILNQTRQGTFSSSTTINAGSWPTFLAAGDFNSDGKADLAVSNRQANNAGVFTQRFDFDMNGSYISAFTPLPYDAFEASADWNLTVTGQGQNLTVDLSNNNGQTWHRAARGQTVDFPSTGNTLGYRLRLTSGAINQTPRFENITLRYTMHSYPVDPSLDIGPRGAPIWNWTGPFGTNGDPASVDFTERLNATLHDAQADAEGNVDVVFVLSSRSLGRLRLSSPVVAYDLAPSPPVLGNLRDNEFTTSQTPFFKMSANDSDTSLLKFRFELSLDDFKTVRSGYSQLVTTDNWDKPGYRPGETATYQLSHYDRLSIDGEYQWRAYVWDGTVWSTASEKGRLRVDTKAPDSRVAQLPAYTNTTTFTVSWDGSDPEPGSGLHPDSAFDVQYKDRESSPWVDWLVATNLTSAGFTGQQGKRYFFQVRARDAAGNFGSFPMGGGDTQTIVDTTPPVGTVTDDGEVSGNNTRLHAVLGFNDFESDVIRYEYWIGTTPGGNETFGPVLTDRSDVTASPLFLQNGTRYYISARALNRAGLWSQAMTTDGIVVRLKLPYALISPGAGVQAGTEIELSLDSTDPNGLGITDSDLEYRLADISNRLPIGWSAWQEIGDGDWGDQRPAQGPFVYTGEPGKAYRFRYRVMDRAGTYSDFVEQANYTRIDRPPEPRITVPPVIQAGRPVLLSANTSTDPDGDKLRYTWDLGDGGVDWTMETRHTFKRPGKYTVTLYVDDGVMNVSTVQLLEVRARPAVAEHSFLYTLLTVVLLSAAAGGVYVFIRRGRARPARALDATPSEAAAEYAPVVVPGSERFPPPPPPPTAAEVEYQIEAARAEVADLEEQGIDTVRTTKMLGLASSFLAEGNLEMAAQYAKKTVKLARDQRSRKESEVDEDAARRFVADTQQRLDELDASGFNVKPAKRLMGLSISFLADGNYITGMQYSKKVRKMLDEIAAREAAPATREAIERDLEAAREAAGELRGRGEDTSQVDREIETARLFLDEEDLPPARERAFRALELVRGLRETERPMTPQQWKEGMAAARELVEKGRSDGLKVAEPARMLKFSESFALQGNMEVATQYLRKAERLMEEMDARARVDASRPENAKGRAVCPKCGEEVEPDWVVCAFCNQKLKEPPKKALVAKPVDDEEAASRKVAKVATVVDGKGPEEK